MGEIDEGEVEEDTGPVEAVSVAFDGSVGGEIFLEFAHLWA
jgi:hypothetical protein